MSNTMDFSSLPASLRDRAVDPLKIAGYSSLMAAAAVALLTGDATGFWSAWLHGWLFAITIGLGALLFVALQYLTNAGWSVVVRRVAECLSVTIVPISWLALPLLVALLCGEHSLFVWNDSKHVTDDPILSSKSVWLNAPFFALRTVACLTVWSWLALRFYAGSVRSDTTTNAPQLTSLRRRSGPALIVLGITITVAAFDWIMSLDPHWFSSILGVYLFASAMVAGLAGITLTVLILRRAGWLKEVTTEHLHDLGKLLFGFNCFWAYIAFSQYLLIWYANITEETVWYYHRQIHGWAAVSVVLIVLHFVLPFFGLMSRRSKRHAPTLAFWAAVLLVANWLDLYWLIMPSLDGQTVSVSVLDVLTTTGFALLVAASFLAAASGRSLIPGNDPLLRESLEFHNH